MKIYPPTPTQFNIQMESAEMQYLYDAYKVLDNLVDEALNRKCSVIYNGAYDNAYSINDFIQVKDFLECLVNDDLSAMAVE